MISKDTFHSGLHIRETLDLEVYLQDYESGILRDPRLTLRDWLERLHIENPLRKRVLEEAILVDLEVRLKRGENIVCKDYVQALPEIENQGSLHFEIQQLFHRFAASADPTDFGHFRIFERVGQGTFGTVHRACDVKLSRIVALKRLKVTWENRHERDRARGYFLREGMHAAKLNHPNIATVFEVGQYDHQAYIAFRFVHGGNLADQIRQGPVESMLAARIAERLADALAHAHHHGLVHRDIKPSNVLMETPSGPVLTDFGLSKDMLSQSLRNYSGGLVGTLAYMAPEQLRSTQGLDHRVDIYALGCVIYEMITAIAPFRGATEDLLLRILREPAISPRSLDRSIPKDLETICLKAMAKAPTDRYRQASELRDDLQAFIDGRPICARPPSYVHLIGLTVRRYPLIAGLLLTLVAGATIAAAFAWRDYRKDMISQARTQELFAHSESVLTQLVSLDTSNQAVSDQVACSYESRRRRLCLIGEYYRRWLAINHEPSSWFDTSEDAADELARMLALYHLGDVERLLGNWTEAIAPLRQASEIARGLSQRQVYASQVVPTQRSILRLLRDSPEGLMSPSQRCDLAYEAYDCSLLGNRDFEQVRDTVSLAGILMRYGRTDQSDQFYRIAMQQIDTLPGLGDLQFGERSVDRIQTDEMLFTLGKTAMRLGLRDRARMLLMQLIDSPEKPCSQDYSCQQLDAEASHYLAGMLRAEDPRLALAYALRAQSRWSEFLSDVPLDSLGEPQFKEIDLRVQLGHNSNLIGGLYADLQENSRGIEAFSNACLHYQRVGALNRDVIPRAIQRGIGNALHSLGRCLQENGQSKKAAERFEQALAVRAELVASIKDPEYRDLQDLQHTRESLQLLSAQEHPSK